MNYFHHANSYWDQKTGDSMCGTATDLWDTDKPGANQQPGGVNCSSKKYNPTGPPCIYEELLFTKRLVSVIEAHDVSTPLFLYYPAHLVHLSYAVPQSYLDRMSIVGGGPFDNVTDTSDQLAMRMIYHGERRSLPQKAESFAAISHWGLLSMFSDGQVSG